MKQITIILFLILMSCKSETKTENDIDQTVYKMWDNYTKSHPQFNTEELPDSFYFHNNEEDANRLLALILSGKKKAGSSLYYWYEEANADLPRIGTKSIVTDFDGKARAIIETKRVDTIPFNKVLKEYAALDMGTQVEPLKKWKKAHWDFFAPAIKQSGAEPTEEMLIVCEWFEIIWLEKNNEKKHL